MRPVVTDAVGLSVGRSVCHNRELCKMTEPIEIPFVLWTRVGPRKHVIDRGAYWRHLGNTIEPSMCGGNAAFLSSYFDHLFNMILLHAVAAGVKRVKYV